MAQQVEALALQACWHELVLQNPVKAGDDQLRHVVLWILHALHETCLSHNMHTRMHTHIHSSSEKN